MAGVEGKLEVKVAHSAQDWRRAKEALGREHGYRPLLAESFSDPESHAGTVYTATNSTQAGTTKGFSQDHSDYYIPNGRPKKATVRVILDKGGDYLIGTKENTSKRLDAAIHALEGSPFLT